MHEVVTESSVGPGALDGKSSPPRRFSVNVALTLGTRLIMLAGGIGTSVIAARRLGPRGFGILAVLNVLVALAVQFGCIGLPSANTYFLTRDRRTLRKISIISLAVGLTVGTILPIAIILFARTRPGTFGDVPLSLIIIAVTAIPFQLLTLFGLNLFLALGEIDRINLIDAGGQLLLLVNALVVLLIIKAGLITLVAANTASATIIALIVVSIIGHRIGREDGEAARGKTSLFRKMIRYGVKFHISVVAGIIILRADLLLVNHFRGTAEAGAYALAAQIGNLLLLLPGIIASLLFPRVAADADVNANFTTRVTRHTALVMLVACLGAIPLSYTLPLLYGAPFGEATLLLLILLPGIYLYGIEAVMVQHFTGTGLPLLIPVFWLIALLFNMTLNLIFIPSYGARAAAVTSTLTYSLIFLLVALYFRKKTGSALSHALLLKRSEFTALPALMRLGLFSR